MSFEVELLGEVRAWSGGVEVPLGPPRQRAVFAVLADQVNRVVPRSELIDALWEESPANVAGSLYTYISALRRALEPNRESRAPSGFLESRGTGYLLRIPADGVDVARFESLRDRATGLLVAEAYADALRVLDEALDLWHGEAFDGIPGPYAAGRRTGLAERRLAARELRAEALLGLGAHADVIVELTGLARAHPHRERIRRLLMDALSRDGRRAEALDVYQDTRRLLVEAFGVEPGPALQQLHQRILADAPAPRPEPVLSARTSRHIRVPPVFVNRVAEVARLRAMVADLAAGTGGVAWIQGEPGIGKSALLAAGLAGAEEAGCRIGWACADELGPQFPLGTVLDCLDADVRASETVTAAADRLVAFAEELCERAPLLLVVDDLQWADESSLMVWHRLARASRRLPLLLVGSARCLPRRPLLDQLRRSVEGQGGFVCTIEPLVCADVADLVRGLFGAPPGPELKAATARAAGNPLYVRELLDALHDAVTVDDSVAELRGAARVPDSLVATLSRRLSFLTSETREVLQWATLLGSEFAVKDLAVISGRSMPDLLPLLTEATAGHVLIDGGPYLRFRHDLVRQALYEATPEAIRLAQHSHAAEALAKAGAPLEKVSQQLLAGPDAVDGWMVTWLEHNSSALGRRAPRIAVDLIRRVLADPSPGSQAREALTAELAHLLFGLGGSPDAEARYVLDRTKDVERMSAMRSILAHLHCRRGTGAAAVELLRESIECPDVPERWKARHEVLTAAAERIGNHDLVAAEVSARRAVWRAQACGDADARAHGLQELWVLHSIRRDHRAALADADLALALTADVPELEALRLSLMDRRLFSLQNLDRFDEAHDTLLVARELGRRRAVPTELHLPTAFYHFWLGQWDDALAELDGIAEDSPEMTYYGLRESSATLLLVHGLAALMSLRRGQDEPASAHLHAAEELSVSSHAERANHDFLLNAQAVAQERAGCPGRALEVLAPIVTSDYSPMMLRHQWLPYITRLAIDVGDTGLATTAAHLCGEEARLERQPARAFAASLRCTALVTGDPQPALRAAGHYRRVGRTVELAHTLEDVAVLQVRRGDRRAAQVALDEAVAAYSVFGATWDVHRAVRRAGLTPTASIRPASSRLPQAVRN
ncbi:BTAD domain-containing putative transcriptional regulator [Lentzea sp. NPDC051213]|uniref:BTAD domain-containing putative transcriptional regulator n=1 Tax=Lentzea sp. NPDC051213 TaxID=3364126 RepID=UPI00378E3C7C